MIPTFRPLLVLFIIPTICSKSLISFLPAMLAHCTDYQWLPIGTMATSTQHDTHHVMSQFSLGQQIFLNIAKNMYSLLKHLGVGKKDLNECFRKKEERWERRRRRWRKRTPNKRSEPRNSTETFLAQFGLVEIH